MSFLLLKEDLKYMAIVNGIDVDFLVDNIGSVKEKPELGHHTFKSETEWKGGTLSESKIRQFTFMADEPTWLGGTDKAPNPVELMLGAFSACLATGYAANAAAMGIKIENMRIVQEGYLDLAGFFGISDEIRPGFQNIKTITYIKTDAPKEKLDALKKHVEKTSPCGDICSNPIRVVSSELVFE
jgi:uncharacterized OsmC-like protein